MSGMSTAVKRRLMALTTAISLLATTGLSAMAAENTYTSDGDATVPITATVASSYTVVLPSVAQNLSDPDNDGTYTGTIHYDVFGKVNSDKALIVLAGETTGLSVAEDVINGAGYATTHTVAHQFHMSGTTGGQTVAGVVENSVIRFMASGATPVSPMDTIIPSAKSDTAPFEAAMSIDIPYTDTFTGNMPFRFGLINA